MKQICRNCKSIINAHLNQSICCIICLFLLVMYIIKLIHSLLLLCNSNKEGWDHSPSIWTSLTAVLPVIWDTGPQTYSIHWSVNTKKGKIKNLWITYQFYHLQSLAQHSISSGIWTSYKIDTHIKDLNMFVISLLSAYKHFINILVPPTAKVSQE